MSGGSFIKLMMKKISKFAVHFYVLVLFLILPLYAPEGYVHLGNYKCKLYLYGAVLAAAMLLLAWLINIIISLITFKQSSAAKAGYAEVETGYAEIETGYAEADAGYAAAKAGYAEVETNNAVVETGYFLAGLKAPDICMLLFGLSIILSTILSVDFGKAVTGENGWYCGCIMQLLAVFYYFVFRKEERWDRYCRICLYLASGLAFSFTVLNRFLIFPLPFMRDDSLFVSTLGQINWFCGYASILLPYAMGQLYLLMSSTPAKTVDEIDDDRTPTRSTRCSTDCRNLSVDETDDDRTRIRSTSCSAGSRSLSINGTDEDKTLTKLLLSLYVLIGLTSLILQGSNSAFMYLSAVYVMLYAMAWGNRRNIKAATWLLFLFLLSSAVLHVIMEIRPELISTHFYDASNYGAAVVGSRWSIAAALICGILMIFLNRRPAGTDDIMVEDEADMDTLISSNSARKTSVRLLQLVLGLIMLAAIALAAAQIFAVNLYSDHFGNNRGLIWHTAAAMFREFPLLRKLFGAGPDCFYIYSAQEEKYLQVLHVVFGDVVMNAHSVLLNRMVTTGLAGTATYLLALGTAFRSMSRSRQAFPFLLAVAACFVNNMVSFDQVTNFTYMFVLLGAGVAASIKKSE